MPEREILVRDDTIVAVEKGRIAAPGATVLDLGGRTVMPGLVDCHVHICADGMTAQPTILPSFLAATAGRILHQTLLRGFTTVRDNGGADIGFTQAVEAGLFVGPRLFVAGRPIGQTGGHADFRNPADLRDCGAATGYVVIADGVDAVRKAAREELRRGAHHLKVMASGGIASPADQLDHLQYTTDELTAVVEEARRAGTYVSAHAYSAAAIARAIDAGVRTIEHGNFLDEPTAKEMARRGAILVPTLIVYRRIVAQGAALGLPAYHLAKARQVLEVGTRSLEIARRAGVEMAYGTDLFRAPKEHQAEELLVRAEVLTAAEILRSATVIGARVVGLEGRIGRVVPGHLADLLVVDGDPLTDLGLLQDQGAHLSLIMKNGDLVKDTLSGAAQPAATSRAQVPRS